MNELDMRARVRTSAIYRAAISKAPGSDVSRRETAYQGKTNPIRVIASTLRVLVGLAGIEHCIFEVLYGIVATDTIIISAIGPVHRIWRGASR
jgi:hypothetical protein